MGEHERIYPRKPRKPKKDDIQKRMERQRRAHKRINKGRVKAAVRKWDEWRELKKILDNPNQPTLTDCLPKEYEEPEWDENEEDPENGF